MTMAKSQRKSNKEVRKPKAEKVKTIAANASTKDNPVAACGEHRADASHLLGSDGGGRGHPLDMGARRLIPSTRRRLR
jgi:hypothetical protein